LYHAAHRPDSQFGAGFVDRNLRAFSSDVAATLISMPNSDGVAIIEFGLVSAAK
jgi:hypothetical protein